MLAAPKKFESEQYLLENDFILPSIQLIYDLLLDLKMPTQRTRECFVALLSIIDEEKISKKSKALPYGKGDFDLKHHITKILSNIDQKTFNDIYQSLYVLLHQYYLNKSPDNPQDLIRNAQVAEAAINNNLTREQLFDSTVPVFDKLSKRLSKFDDIGDEEIKPLVLKALIKAKESVLNPAPVTSTVVKTTNNTFLPLFRDPVALKQRLEAQMKARQLAEDEELAQRLAQQIANEAQEAEDRVFALALQNEHSDNDEDEYEENNEVDEALDEAVNQRIDEQRNHNDDDDDEDNDSQIDEDQDDEQVLSHSSAARTRPKK